ncbi:MAG: fumarate hydratase [Clostridiales bacterium]|jgi:fumarate hydratase subunit alpha|nr:fumarate hydratase [Clostridiales bacterium]
MRTICVEEIAEQVKRLCISSNRCLNADISGALEAAAKAEDFPAAREILGMLIENAEAARAWNMPICQDTGMAVVFLEIGQDVRLAGGDIGEAVQRGVRDGYAEGLLRKSVVRDPLRRENTNDNTPAVIHFDIVPGDGVKITVAPKGFGSENMSAIKMLPPSAGQRGVEDFIVSAVESAASNPCPPVVVGAGIGGTFEKCALLAKRALLRPISERNADAFYGGMETRLLERINALGIGPQGFGGRTTALAVNIETFPTHIAGLPVAVNMSCHVTRHAEAAL